MKGANVIPQVFYDLIARIVPGIILLFCAMIVHYGPDHVAQGATALVGQKGQAVNISFYLFLIVCVLAYATALVVMGIWVIFIKISKRCNLIFLKDDDPRWTSIKQNLEPNLKKAGDHLGFTKGNRQNDIPSMAFIYDFVRLCSPEVGSRLVKIRAECHMCAVIVTGLIAIGIWNLFKIIASPTRIELIIELGIVLVIIAFWSFMRDLEERLMTGLCNYWALLHSPAMSQEDHHFQKN